MLTLEIYVNEKWNKVDLSETESLVVKYQNSDATDPTVTLSSYSKTIQLKGTKANNKIFDEIYRLDNQILNFDPTQKTPFRLSNNTLLMSGYLQLNSIEVSPEQEKTYNITLYSGIGEFFYNLAYDEDGNERKLSDLRFAVRDNGGNLLPKETELDFVVNKEFVKKCWDKTSWNSEKVEDFITFVPAYNGLPDNFNADKCLVNTDGLTSTFPSSMSDNGTTYSTVSGYGLAELNKDYDEWEIGDLRSYLQRPAIKLDKLIKTIVSKENSGYDVTLDGSFFNGANPYWNDTFVVLPHLADDKKEGESKGDVTITYLNSLDYLDGENKDYQIYANARATAAGSNIFDISSVGGYNNITVRLPINVRTLVPANGPLYDHLYLSSYIQTVTNGAWQSLHAIGVQMIITDESGNITAGSPVYVFGNRTSDSRNRVDETSTTNYLNRNTAYRFKPVLNTEDVYIFGYFRQEMANAYKFIEGTTQNDTFVLEASGAVGSKFQVRVYTYMFYSSENSQGIWGGRNYYDNLFFKSFNNNLTPNNTWSDISVRGEFQSAKAYGQNGIIETFATGTVKSNTNVTKNMLLASEYSPLDYLLSYTKMFGLYFIKDPYDKKITITTRNNYFNGETEDIKLDEYRTYKINPLIYDTKWLRFGVDTPETTYAEEYKKYYGEEYGIRKVNANYTFNNETKELLEDNIYQNAVSVLKSDRYFRLNYNRNNVILPAFVADNLEWQLFSGSLGNYTTFSRDIYGGQSINRTLTQDWNERTSGADVIPKLCLYDDRNSPMPFEDVLVFYNGLKYQQTTSGTRIPLRLSDDISIMGDVADGSCWIYSNSSSDVIQLYSIPQFTRYYFDNTNNITYSLDFGKPKVTFIEGNYSNESTICAQYWDKYIGDLTNKNTKVVDAYIQLPSLKVSEDMLRGFYRFGGSLWVIDNIEVDLFNDGTAKVRFIRVNEQNNYTSGVPDFYR